MKTITEIFKGFKIYNFLKMDIEWVNIREFTTIIKNYYALWRVSRTEGDKWFKKHMRTMTLLSIGIWFLTLMELAYLIYNPNIFTACTSIWCGFWVYININQMKETIKAMNEILPMIRTNNKLKELLKPGRMN